MGRLEKAESQAVNSEQLESVKQRRERCRACFDEMAPSHARSRTMRLTLLEKHKFKQTLL